MCSGLWPVSLHHSYRLKMVKARISISVLSLFVFISVCARSGLGCCGMSRESDSAECQYSDRGRINLRPECMRHVKDIFFEEADSFLAGMPAGLQTVQTAAVRKAIAGDTEALDKVRSSRNVGCSLPEGVIARDISPALRLYSPVVPCGKRLPLLVYFHGGGWTFGSINSCSGFCSELAATGDVIVLAVNYRLAPEHPFPEGLEDCVDAIRVARSMAVEWGSSPDMVSAGGDSSGGNLALASALYLICRGESPLRSLLLFYPVINAWNDDSESWRRYAAGAALDGTLMEAFNEAYARGREHHPLVSVSMFPDSVLSRLPSTLLVAAGRDILCSQGKDFIDRLSRLGVPAERREIAGAVHLFITVPGQACAFRQSVSWACNFLSNCGH